MKTQVIALLKQIAETENISVDYHDGGKSYIIPSAAILVDRNYDPVAEYEDDMDVAIDCSYNIQMGMPFLHYEIFVETSDKPIESGFIPLDPKRRNAQQREMMSLINLCSKRIIAQEMSRKKYAIDTALSSMIADKQFS